MSGACQHGYLRGLTDNSLSIFTSSRVEWLTLSLSRVLDTVVFTVPQSYLAYSNDFCEDLRMMKHAIYRLTENTVLFTVLIVSK